MFMKTAWLIHNPTAGDGKYKKKQLVALIKAAGYRCLYTSSKGKKWQNIPQAADFIIVAGGDGTVRKVAGLLLERPLLEKQYPIAILPMGTANNIAGTLGISRDPEEVIASWSTWHLQPFDTGGITGFKKHNFFLESLGFGIFPNLINEMHRLEKPPEDPGESIKVAQKILRKTIRQYDARKCRLRLDGVDHSGKFLLVEIMNTSSIGPNLVLNPHADPGDGELEVVIIPEKHKRKFAAYIDRKIKGEKDVFSFTTIKAREIEIQWEGIHIHTDDKIIRERARLSRVSVSIRRGVLNFLGAGTEKGKEAK